MIDRKILRQLFVCVLLAAPNVLTIRHQACPFWCTNCACELTLSVLTHSQTQWAVRHTVYILCVTKRACCVAPCCACHVILSVLRRVTLRVLRVVSLWDWKTNLWLPEMGSFLIQIYSQTYSMFRYNFCFLPLERVHLDSVYVFSRMHTLDACQMRKPQTGISQSDSKCK